MKQTTVDVREIIINNYNKTKNYTVIADRGRPLYVYISYRDLNDIIIILIKVEKGKI